MLPESVNQVLSRHSGRISMYGPSGLYIDKFQKGCMIQPAASHERKLVKRIDPYICTHD